MVNGKLTIDERGTLISRAVVTGVTGIVGLAILDSYGFTTWQNLGILFAVSLNECAKCVRILLVGGAQAQGSKT